MGCCYNCGHLDKTRKYISKQSPWCYQYGCNYRGADKYMCGTECVMLENYRGGYAADGLTKVEE